MNDKRAVVTFLGLTFLFSSVFYALILVSGKIGGGAGLYASGIMWCPGLAALLTCRIHHLPILSLGWGWGHTKYQIASYLIPLGYTLIAYVLAWSFGFGGFPSSRFIESRAELIGISAIPQPVAAGLFLLLNATYGFVRSCANALGEEIGWRGFLVPRLAGWLSFAKTSLISGLIWAVWHYPILLFADYNAGTPRWYSLSCFTVMVVAMSFIFAWLRLRSGSLWTAVFMHASHNLFIQSIFTPLTVPNEKTPYAIDEFGFLLPLVTIIVAVFFWRKSAGFSLTLH